MPKSIIAEGKTTNEAIENGLKELKVSKNMVEIKVLENEEKRSFFSILAPRVVKVELTLKENQAKPENVEYTEKPVKKEERNIDIKDLEEAKNNIEEFIKTFIEKTSNETYSCEVKIVDQNIEINITGENLGFLIGYRGDVLNAMQTILSSIANN